ncbi:hypothetical protein BY996DRAFT_6411545 [Phakopsora pachyrhizi]|nr:hypothetical protein BY996DRAFT_6411545 [Phakopsora pachyrhizi]
MISTAMDSSSSNETISPSVAGPTALIGHNSALNGLDAPNYAPHSRVGKELAEIPQNMQPINYEPALHPEHCPHTALVPLLPQILPSQPQHINDICENSGVGAAIYEAVPGNAEQILTVGGHLDTVSKAFGLIVRRNNDEFPNSQMGSVIGKARSKIKEIQDMSGALGDLTKEKDKASAKAQKYGGSKTNEMVRIIKEQALKFEEEMHWLTSNLVKLTSSNQVLERGRM